MTNGERQLYTPNDECNYDRIEGNYASRLSAIIAMGEAAGAEVVERDVHTMQAVGRAATEFAQTGKPYMNGMNYRDVVL